MRIVGSSVGLFENTIQECSAYNGGGVYVEFNAQATIDGNAFLRNSAHSGGAIRINDSCSGSILNNTIAENWVSYYGYADGGGLWIDGNPTISGNTIVDNSAEDYGGGIFCNNGAAPTIDHNVIARNTADFGGGIGFSNGTSGTLLLNNTVAENEAESGGGGLRAWDSDMEIVNTIFWDNTADEGHEMSTRERIECHHTLQHRPKRKVRYLHRIRLDA